MSGLYKFFGMSAYEKTFSAQKPIRVVPSHSPKRSFSLKKYFVTSAVSVAISRAIILHGAIVPTARIFGVTVSHGRINNNEKIAALTFDDGPYGEATKRILDILKEKNIHATFFVTGENVQRYPEILRGELIAGHIVGNHSFNHSKTLVLRSAHKIKNNVLQTNHAIFKIAKLHPRLFRPPYGLKSPFMIGALKKIGYTIVLWDDATKDWSAKKSPETITKQILKRLKPGTIIDLHDGRDAHRKFPRQNLIAALPGIIDRIHQQGYTFVTLDKLIKEKPYF